MKILVGNLDFGATEELVRSAFELYGPVEYVSIPADTLATPAGYGFALVEMKYPQQADRAIAALNGARLGLWSKGPLFLVAVPQEPRQCSGGPSNPACLSSGVLPSYPAARRRLIFSSSKSAK